ncbi:MAG: hypothetical protein ACFFG0_11690 [Candidatus Thorarchaeota archaeon]
MIRKQHMLTNLIDILITPIVILLGFLMYFLVFSNTNVKKGSDAAGENAMAKKAQIVIKNAIYSKPKGVLEIGVWNKGKKDLKIDKIVLVSGTVSNPKTIIETAPSKTIEQVLKPDETKSFKIEASELPDGAWIVPAENPESISILSKKHIKIEE